jgi:predicted LPLAT superfamily acyltransferase
VPGPTGERDQGVRAALERYVATLEALCRAAPYNWFNFFDFWADADADANESA